MTKITVLLLPIATLAFLNSCAARRRPPVATVPIEKRLDDLQHRTDENLKAIQESQKTVNEQLARIETEVKESSVATSKEVTSVGGKATAALDKVAAIHEKTDDISRRMDSVERVLADIRNSLQSKKEPVDAGSPCVVVGVEPASESLLAAFRQREGLLRLLPAETRFRFDAAYQYSCQGDPHLLLVVPTERDGCLGEATGLAWFLNGRDRLSAVVTAVGPGRFRVRDESGSGFDTSPTQSGPSRATTVGPRSSFWACAAARFTKRFDAYEAGGFVVNTAFCAGGLFLKMPGYCSGLVGQATAIVGDSVLPCFARP